MRRHRTVGREADILGNGKALEYVRQVMLWVLVGATINGVDLLCASVAAQSGPDDEIRITNPVDGTVVVPGETLGVTVEVGPNTSFDSVQIIGEEIGITAPITTPPYQFEVTIPNDAIGRRKITALGEAGPGAGIFSTSVVVDVEPASTTADLEITPPRITLRFPGDRVGLLVMGTFADGAVSVLTESSRTHYESDDPGVASVDSSGTVTAVGPGTAAVSVWYGATTVAIPVSIPELVVGDLNRDGVVSQDDVNIVLDYAGVPASGPFDARDLNHDGEIDVLDAQEVAQDCMPPCTVPEQTPVADAGLDSSTECTGASGTTVQLDGTDSYDPDGSSVTCSWGSDTCSLLDPDSCITAASCPLGTNVVVLIVNDGTADSVPDTVVITVQDTVPPAALVTVNPASLWPPDHQLAKVKATIAASDACGATYVSLTSVTSSEPDEAPGDVIECEGRPGDIRGAEIGTDDRVFHLRAERLDPRIGRIYEVLYTVSDEAGNVSTASAEVRVPGGYSDELPAAFHEEMPRRNAP